MQEFYRLRVAQPRRPKAEALRLAQLALLKGIKKKLGASEWTQERLLRRVTILTLISGPHSSLSVTGNERVVLKVFIAYAARRHQFGYQ